jgi:hypothetical protein
LIKTFHILCTGRPCMVKAIYSQGGNSYDLIQLIGMGSEIKVDINSDWIKFTRTAEEECFPASKST